MKEEPKMEYEMMANVMMSAPPSPPPMMMAQPTIMRKMVRPMRQRKRMRVSNSMPMMSFTSASSSGMMLDMDESAAIDPARDALLKKKMAEAKKRAERLANETPAEKAARLAAEKKAAEEAARKAAEAKKKAEEARIAAEKRAEEARIAKKEAERKAWLEAEKTKTSKPDFNELKSTSHLAAGGNWKESSKWMLARFFDGRVLPEDDEERPETVWLTLLALFLLDTEF